MPDDEGVVTAVSVDEVELDRDRTYDLADDLVSFSTYTMESVPVLQRMGQYVQVGLDGDTVVWIATVGDAFPGEPPTAYYTGELEEVRDDGRLVFADGTVLRLASGVEPSVRRGSVIARIDASAKRVIEILPT